MLGSPESSGYPVFPICSLFAPGHPGASPPSVYRYIELGALVLDLPDHTAVVQRST